MRQENHIQRVYSAVPVQAVSTTGPLSLRASQTTSVIDTTPSPVVFGREARLIVFSIAHGVGEEVALTSTARAQESQGRRAWLGLLATAIPAQRAAPPQFLSSTGSQVTNLSNGQGEARSNWTGAVSGRALRNFVVGERSLTTGDVGNMATSLNALDRRLLPSDPLLDLRS
jgi:hypothetical protein